MLNGKTTLTDIIEVSILQSLQDSISEAANISAVILDSTGDFITEVSNARRICALGGDACNDAGLCRITQRELLRMAEATRQPSYLDCPISGMTGVSVPIFLGELFLGAWIISPVWFSGDDPCTFVQALHRLGVSSDVARQMLVEVPVINRSGFQMIVSFVSIVTGEVVKLASSNMEIMEKNRRLMELAAGMEHSMDALRAFADTPGLCIYLSDFYTGEILMCNSVYADYFHKTPEEMIGTRCYENLGKTQRCPSCRNHNLVGENDAIRSPCTWEHYYEQLGASFQTTSQVVRWMDGRLVNLLVSMDITERKKMEDDLCNLAYFDKILHIKNADRMEADMKEDTYEYLVLVRLADLKRINHAFGRKCGDALLLAARDYILNLGISCETLYRGIIGDFCLLFKHAGKDAILPQIMAEQFHARCKRVWEITMTGQRHNLYTDVDICVLPLQPNHQHEHFFAYLSNVTAHSLNIAHETGSVVLFDEDMKKRFHDSLRLENGLINAVRNNMEGFSVVFQPIIDMGSAMWRGLEALCRWSSPEFGVVPPGVFIPVAESGGLINDIGLWVLEQAIIRVKEWGLDRIDGFVLEVNLSPVQLTVPRFDRIIVNLLEKYGYPPEKLGLEITESNKLNFSSHTLDAIVRLSELGVIIVLDDFGTGYSSFNSLHKLPVSVLKTDRTFITGIENDKHLRNLLRLMVTLAHSTDMKFVAEGVENDQQVQFLLRQGTDLYQGYFFSRPLNSRQLEEKLDNFYVPVEQLLALGYTKWDIATLNERQSGMEEYVLNPEMYQLLDRCVWEILRNTNNNSAIVALLAHTGENLRVSRAYVFLKDPAGTFSNTHEWCAPGIDPEKDSLQQVAMIETAPQWTQTLIQKGLLVAADVRTLEDEAYESLRRQNVKAVVEFPIWKSGEMYGFVGFDDCVGIHNWHQEEVQMLYILTGLITSILGRIWLEDETAAVDKMRESVLNGIGTLIYVTDLETNEILFANTALRNMYGDSPLTGRVCWEALQNRTSRCRFCPVPHLLKNPGKDYEWNFFNNVFGKRYRVHDSIIPWSGGRLAHLEYAAEAAWPNSATEMCQASG